MLNIKIVEGNQDGSLKFEDNGHPNNGNSKAERNSAVHWKVKPNIDVQNIQAIKMKTSPPTNTNIFTKDPPEAQGGPHSTHWKATVDKDAPVGAEYHYEIHWQHIDGSNKICDPKIAVLPTI